MTRKMNFLEIQQNFRENALVNWKQALWFDGQYSREKHSELSNVFSILFPDYSDITTLNTVMGGWMSRGEEDSL